VLHHIDPNTVWIGSSCMLDSRHLDIRPWDARCTNIAVDPPDFNRLARGKLTRPSKWSLLSLDN
jgi:hypothetical protein